MSTCPVVGSTVDTSATPPLYDRVGGRDAVAAVVELLYKKILADDGLNSFFTRTDMKRLKRHQASQIGFLRIELSDSSRRQEQLCVSRLGSAKRDGRPCFVQLHLLV